MFRIATLLTIPLALAACTSSVTSRDQLVAEGKGIEITTVELDQVLRAAPPVKKDQVDRMRLTYLNQLIDDRLFAKEAMRIGLDDDPKVKAEIDAARRVVLARAKVARLFADMPEPSDRAVQVFYQRNRPLFAARTAYAVDQLPLTGPPDVIDDNRALFDRAGLEGLIETMRSRGSQPAVTHDTLLDLQLAGAPPSIVASLQPGSKIAYVAPPLQHVGVIRAVERGPLSLGQARDEIVRRIGVQQRIDLIRSEAQRLREAADIKLDEANLAKASFRR